MGKNGLVNLRTLGVCIAIAGFFILTGGLWSFAADGQVQSVILAYGKLGGHELPSKLAYGIEKFTNSAIRAGWKVSISENTNELRGQMEGNLVIFLKLDTELAPEAFSIIPRDRRLLLVEGGDWTGLMYGLLELAERITRGVGLPVREPIYEKPTFKLRGVCVGLQKPYILPGRQTYEYPITPDLFPWFYDRAMWTEFLDFLAANRYNALFLWNGHPFASLVRVPGYEYAVEVPEDIFEQNRAQYRWLASECERRGIWLVQMFYSLIVSEPFAKKHGIRTQLSDLSHGESLEYTRRSLAKFIEDFPHVGLLVCLGEALRGVENQKRFLLETIIPGVMDGMRESGLTQQPPIIVRAHATDPEIVMPAAAAVYSNLYTMAKYNGEALTTWEPRGLWQRRHLMMSQLTSNHVVNVHILANLEPFRFGAQRFIQKCVLAMRDRLGASGLHLYPLSYWNWPFAPDRSEQPLKQWDRDWMWYTMWARYAWNPDRPEGLEREFWIVELGRRFGSARAGELILDALNDAGECAPRLLRRFGITDGNRQTLSLGMTLDQLTDPERFNPYPELWLSHAPHGERLQEYVAREVQGHPHEGETPPQVIAEVLFYSSNAVQKVEAASKLVRTSLDEFNRIYGDVLCIRAMCEFYANKVNAAACVLRYRHTGDVSQLEKAAEFLENSVIHFRKLTELTQNLYLFANSLQTSHRRIPVIGAVDNSPTNYHWIHLLPIYERELAEFTNKLAKFKARQSSGKISPTRRVSWPQATFQLLSTNAETYRVEIGARPFMDRQYRIVDLSPELSGLVGIRFSHEEAKSGRYTPIEFQVNEPVWVLIGYFQENRSIWLQPPNPDFDAGLAGAAGIEPVLVRAVRVENCPDVNVHAVPFSAGRHQLRVHGPGSFLILGVVPQSFKLEPRTEEEIRF